MSFLKKWQRQFLIVALSTAISTNSLIAECDNAARIAAMESGVPLQVLMAIARTETGRSSGDGVSPWPWTINEGGHGKFFPDKEQALEYLNKRINEGISNADIGCFQINFRWHRQNFQSTTEMINPISNARYAAKLLLHSYSESLDWIDAAGKFHSRTPELARAYISRFKAFLENAPLTTTKLRKGYPLLRSGATVTGTSLLRSGPGLGSLLSAPARRFFGD